MRPGGVVVGLAFGALFACGSFLAANAPDEGLDGGATPNGDAAVGAALDANAGDGASVIVVDDAAAEAAAPCTAKFCSRFDDGDNPPFNWDRVGPSSADPLAFLGANTNVWVSPPRSFRVETSATTGEEQWVELALPASPSPTAGWIELAVRIEALPVEADTLRFLALNCDSGGDAARVAVNQDGTMTLSTAGGSLASGGPAFAPNTWTPVRLEFLVSGKNVTSTLRRGGASSVLSFDECDVPLKVRLGAMSASSPPNAFALSFDDVMIDWN